MNEERISFSELKVWNECPYKHKLVYVDGLSHFSGNEHTSFGTAIHYVCEKKIQDSTLDERELFCNKFEEELAGLTDVEINEDLVAEMKIQGLTLCTNILPELEKYFGLYELIAVEEPLMESIDEFESYNKKFKGFIDLVIKTADGKYHIIDWKTCSWGWPARRKQDPMTTSQLTYYKKYFCKKHNIDLQSAETYFALIKRTAAKENVEFFKVSSGAIKINNSLNFLKKAIINIHKGNYIKNRLSCKYCKFYKTKDCP